MAMMTQVRLAGTLSEGHQGALCILEVGRGLGISHFPFQRVTIDEPLLMIRNNSVSGYSFKDGVTLVQFGPGVHPVQTTYNRRVRLYKRTTVAEKPP